MADFCTLEPELLERLVDGTLSESEQHALDQELAQDPNLALDLEYFGETVSLLRSAKLVEPPESFLWHVQQRVRRRTRSRWFSPPPMRTFVMEAAICSVMLLATAAMYLVALPIPSPPMTPGSTSTRLHASDRHLLDSVGTIASVGMSIRGDALEVELVIQERDVNRLPNLLDDNPRLTMTDAPVVIFQDAAIVRIAANSSVMNTDF